MYIRKDVHSELLYYSAYKYTYFIKHVYMCMSLHAHKHVYEHIRMRVNQWVAVTENRMCNLLERWKTSNVASGIVVVKQEVKEQL